MFFFSPKKTDIHLLYIVGVYFGKAVTIPFSVGRQKSLHRLQMEASGRKQHVTKWKARVSVLLVLCSLWRMFSVIRCVAYFMCRMT